MYHACAYLSLYIFFNSVVHYFHLMALYHCKMTWLPSINKAFIIIYYYRVEQFNKVIRIHRLALLRASEAFTSTATDTLEVLLHIVPIILRPDWMKYCSRNMHGSCVHQLMITWRFSYVSWWMTLSSWIIALWSLFTISKWLLVTCRGCTWQIFTNHRVCQYICWHLVAHKSATVQLALDLQGALQRTRLQLPFIAYAEGLIAQVPAHQPIIFIGGFTALENPVGQQQYVTLVVFKISLLWSPQGIDPPLTYSCFYAVLLTNRFIVTFYCQ